MLDSFFTRLLKGPVTVDPSVARAWWQLQGDHVSVADLVKRLPLSRRHLELAFRREVVIPAPGASLYIASKGALEQFTAVAAREFGPRGITVNTVSPGATDTDMLRAGNPPESLERQAAITALRRLGRPDDIAAVVGFLAGPDSGWITGQNIRATGGLLV